MRRIRITIFFSLSAELKALSNKAYPPPPKVKAKATPKAGGGVAAPASDEVTPARLDFRVGKITAVAKHPDAGQEGGGCGCKIVFF